MLTEADDVALKHGWLHIDETATPGMLGRIEEHVSVLLENYQPRSRRRLTGVTLPAGLGGISTTLSPERAVGLRRKVSTLLDELAVADTQAGLLITVDEVHSRVEDLRELAVIVQHLVREGRQIALVMAGLPSAVSDLLRGDAQDRVLTFLRRADKHILADVSIDEVRDSFAATIEESGRSIDPEALDAAAEATFGYPFLIQLIGYQMCVPLRSATLHSKPLWAG